MTTSAVLTEQAARRTGITEHFAYVPPNWFATVMGTGIVAVAAHAVSEARAFRYLAIGFWSAACVVFVLVCAATGVHWLVHTAAARAHAHHPVIGHFYGALPMAILTVGTSTMVAGPAVIGHNAALTVDAACFVVGTIGGVLTALASPTRVLRRRHRDDAFGGWLMSVVPPMVSASAAAVLAAQIDSPSLRAALLLVGVSMFLLSFTLTVPILVAIIRRLCVGGIGTTTLVPTWWIVLGPLGQSVTAACLLARSATPLLDGSTSRVADDVALVYAVTVWVMSLGWIVVATVITLRAARCGLPFALAWWSFTFPMGTFVTGSAALAVLGGRACFYIAAAVGLGVLVSAWLIVATRTAAGVLNGELATAPATGPSDRLAGGRARRRMRGRAGVFRGSRPNTRNARRTAGQVAHR